MTTIITDIVDCGTGAVQRGVILPLPTLSLDELNDLINRERDARIDGGFMFGGGRYQSAPSDRENIRGANDFALQAQAAGAEPGDLFWHLKVPDMKWPAALPFGWRLADNTTVPMDAFGPPALYLAAAAFKNSTTLFGFALKEGLEALPENERFASYVYGAAWPV